MSETKTFRLGDALIDQGLITQEQLKDALAEQKRTGRLLGKVLVENNYVSEEQIARVIASQQGIPFVDLRKFPLEPETVTLLPELQARRYRALVLEDRGGTYLVGLTDPSDLRSQDSLALQLKRPIDVAVITIAQFNDVLDRVYRKSDQIGEYVREVEREIDPAGEAVQLSQLNVTTADVDAPVIKLLQTIFEQAERLRASDIHIEPQENKLVVRFRIDGVLHPQIETDPRVHSALLVRLKLLAGLDIAERRLPQDGRLAVRTATNRLDIRLATMPTQFGESAVMRLLLASHGLQDLERLGMTPETLKKFSQAISAPHGMVLVTGPTGSGKSTTLYAALQRLNRPSVKILTCEDPVEYRIAGLNQVQVNEKIDLSFARILRTFLRLDPDILFVGEIRDQDTAEMAARAAATGHLLLSTLHTNDAVAAPARLLDLGLPGYMVATTLSCVVSQRLLRLVCPYCSQKTEPSFQEMEWFRQFYPGDMSQAHFCRGAGCDQCNRLGYMGRIAVHELLEMTPALASVLHAGQIDEFERMARIQIGRETMRDRALELAYSGRTTIEEVRRVISSSVN